MFVALLARVWHLIQIQHAPFFSLLMGDARSYDAWAQRIAAGDWVGTEVFYQAPLYPYLLGSLFAVIGHSLTAVRIFQAALGALACGLLSLAGTRLFDARAGLVAGLLLAVYAPAIYFDGLIQKTTLDAVLVCALLVALSTRHPVTAGRALGLGLLLGALALTRENSLLLVPLIGAWVWVRTDRKVPPIAALGCSLALFLIPVALRNYVIDGDVHFTTSQFGTNLYIGNSETATGGYVPLRNDHSTPEYERRDAFEIAQKDVGRPLSSGEVSAFWRDRALRWVADHPAAWLKLMGRKLLLTWNVVETADTEDIYSAASYSTVLRSITVVNFSLLLALGLVGMWMSRTRWRDVWIFYAIFGTYTLSVVLFYAFARSAFRSCPCSLSSVG